MLYLVIELQLPIITQISYAQRTCPNHNMQAKSYPNDASLQWRLLATVSQVRRQYV